MTKMKEALTDEQVQILLNHLNGHPMEALIRFVLVTGMRRSELLSLKWQDIDLVERTLHFHAKTQGLQSLGITKEIAEMLREHHVRQTEIQAKAGLTWANLDLVFPDGTGESQNPHQLIKRFHEILEQAGLARIRFHDLRAFVKRKELATYKETHG